jgi:hypothetical protein
MGVQVLVMGRRDINVVTIAAVDRLVDGMSLSIFSWLVVINYSYLSYDILSFLFGIPSVWSLG